MYYVEAAFYVSLRKGNMIPVDKAMRERGFRSVYMFTKEDADKIIESGNSRGFSEYIPYSDTLFVDLDDPSFLPLALENLEKLGWRYTYYSSGSKGYHIHITHNQCGGYGLPDLHKELALKVHPQADVSLYRTSSLFRIPGTIHQKTGKTKQYIGQGGKNLLLLPWNIQGVKPVLHFKEFVESNESELALSLNSVIRFLGNPPIQGRRTQTLWAIARGLRDGGLGIQTVKGLLEAVNASWNNDSKDEDTIMRVLQDCQRVSR
jgi:hypothetical protein